MQAKGSVLAAKFSGRWECKHQLDEQGYIFVEYDPYCFNKILAFLRSKAIEHPDYPAPTPVIASEHEAQFNQLVSYLGLKDFVGLDRVHNRTNKQQLANRPALMVRHRSSTSMQARKAMKIRQASGKYVDLLRVAKSDR